MKLEFMRPELLLLVIPAWIFIYLKYAGRDGEGRPLARAIPLMRCLTIFVAFFLLARPVLITTANRLREGIVTVLLDRSASMNVQSGEISKKDKAIELVRELYRLLPPSLEKQVVLFDIDTQLIEPDLLFDEPSSVSFDGPGTNIHEALSFALGREGAHSHTILITDGRHNAPADPVTLARRLSPRLHSLPVGGIEEPPDVGISAFNPDDTAIVGEPLALTVELISSWPETIAVPLALYRDDSDEPAERLVAEVKPGRTSVTIQDVPEKTGTAVYRAVIYPPDADAVEENNQMARAISVISSHISVFMAGSSISHDFSMLLRALALDREVKLEWMVRLHKPGSQLSTTGNVSKLPDPASANRPDVILLHDPDHELINSDYMNKLHKAVDDGMGLIVIAGRNSIASHDRLKTLWSLLPVRPAEPLEYSEAFHTVNMVPALPFMRISPRPDINAALWKNTPRLSSVVTNSRHTAGATVFAHTETGPVGGIHYLGQGQVISLMSDSFWRAGFSHPSAGIFDIYSTFWRQAIRAISPESQDITPVSIQLPADQIPARSEADVHVRVRDHRGHPVSGATVMLTVGNYNFRAGQADDGLYTARLKPLEAGVYEISARATAGGASAGTDSASLIVSNMPGELDRLSADRDYLDELSNLWEPDQIKDLTDYIADSIGFQTVERPVRLANNPFMAIFFLSFLCAEWFIRKLRGHDV